MSRFHVRRRVHRLCRASWRDLLGVYRDGFVFARCLGDGSGYEFGVLSWTGFYEVRGAGTVVAAMRHLDFNRRVVRELRRTRGRRC